MTKAHSDVVTADQLRGQIDSGATREKVSHPDPAAAPLGTDAEAAGFPPTKQQVRLDAASSLERAPGRRRALGLPYLLAVLAAGVLILLLVWLGLTQGTTGEN